jgi:hypothetical protein
MKTPMMAPTRDALDAVPGDGTLVLTVRQPFASAIIYGAKDVENRSWISRRVLGRRVLIHAGAALHDEAARCRELWPWVANVESTDGELPRGAIIGSVFVESFVASSSSIWWTGPFGWKLTRPEKLATPIECRGKMGLWHPGEDVLARVHRGR